MAFSFDPVLATYKDWVRLATQDTDPQCPMLQDETINALIQTLGYSRALASACTAIISMYAQQPDFYQQHFSQEFQWRERIPALKALRERAEAGLEPDPFSMEPQVRMAAIRQTRLQKDRPTITVPTVMPEGTLGGYRSN